MEIKSEPIESAPSIKLETQDIDSSKRGSWQKGKKRKKSSRDATAPRHPLTGYVRFLNDRREKARAENPNLSFSELQKLLGNEWNQLPQNQKQQYLIAAEQDKERYSQEMAAYRQTDAYRDFVQNKLKKKSKQDRNEDENDKEFEYSGYDISIFTEEFLEHNKVRETELRQLRKSATNYEQQNAILLKHLDNMKTAVEKLQSETAQQEAANTSMQKHLQDLRQNLSQKFAALPLPGTNETPTLQTIDNYMSQMLSTLMATPPNQAFNKSVKDVVNSLNISVKDFMSDFNNVA
nr:PREDICTED: high mobility group protein 20A-like [Bemisia tabaci]